MRQIAQLRHGRRLASVVAVLLCLALAGCGRGAANSTEAAPTALPTSARVEMAVEQGTTDADARQMSAEQRAELADGQVTYDEYVAAFGRMRACVAADGYELWMRGEENQVISASIPDAATASYDRCYPREFMAVDAAWQTYRENFGPEAAAMAECLTERGVEPRLTLTERYEQLAGLGIDPYVDCVEVKLGE